tara:strand:- start:2185 stop:2529 length:345 start_codon:yes stop_codon:yes gene_type:complete
MTDTNLIPNTKLNQTKVRQAVSQFMVERVLTKDEIMEHAMSYLEHLYAGHTIADLAAMVKETEIPKARPDGPSQPNRMLCYGTIPGYTGNGAEYYFFDKEQDYEYSACEVKGVR